MTTAFNLETLLCESIEEITLPISAYEELLYTTVHILAAGPEGTADGTGFFYRVVASNGAVSILVTNKHVVEGAHFITIAFHKMDINGERSGDILEYPMQLDRAHVVEHPDPDVDLCAIGLDMDHVSKTAGSAIFNRFLTASTIPAAESWEEMDAFEEMVMIGCPNGLYDQVNRMPIARRGIAASHPQSDFEGKREFLIDMACFPGSSGSPVFLIDRLGQVDKMTGDIHMNKRRKQFVGVLYSGPMIDTDGVVLKRKKQKKVRIESMMHLGYVVKSTEVLRLDDEVRKRLGISAR